MTAFYFPYCPKCWPTYVGEYDEKHRCTGCGGLMLNADKDKAIELLTEQVAALGDALRECTELCTAAYGEPPKPTRPALRVVKDQEPKPS